MDKYPHAHASLLLALEELLNPPRIVILRGEAEEIERWRVELAKLFAPRQIVLAIASKISRLPAALQDKAPIGAAVAYICRANVCSAPVSSLAELIRELRASA
jgi:uncharacterized protein